MMVHQALVDGQDYQGCLVTGDREGHEGLRVSFLFFLLEDRHSNEDSIKNRGYISRMTFCKR